MRQRLPLLLLVVPFPITISATAQTARYAEVISPIANIRQEPSVTSPSVLEIPQRTLVKILDQKLPWYVVRAGDAVGWMHGNTIKFLRVEKSASDSLLNSDLTAPSASRERAVSPESRRSSPPTAHQANNSTSSARSPSTPRDTTEHRAYTRGPRGGCYYINSSGRKVYVDHSLCN